MKKISTVLLIIVWSSILTKAQISVTASDFEAQLVIGKQITTYRDAATSSINIGSAGQSTWDFSALVAANQFITESKAVGPSPYAADFPGVEYASNYEGTFEGTFSNTWVYNSIGDNYVSHGTGTIANSIAGDVKTKITFSPAQIEYKLPVEYQSTWSYEGQQTIATTITVPFLGEQTTSIVRQRTRTFTVDGYGVMKMPDGKSLNALRIREENTLTGSGVSASSVIYRFLSKTGEFVSVTLADGVTANSGTVSTGAISWTTGDGTGIVGITVAAPSILTAVAGSSGIDLSWTDNADNEEGYNIERGEGSGSYSLLAQVSANTNSYSDVTAQSGVNYHYRINAYSGGTTSEYSNIADAAIELTGINKFNNLVPNKFELSQNYPNPFNPTTKINFSIPQNGIVSLKVFNALGEQMAELVNQNFPAGSYSVDFNAADLTSGVYFYKITSGNFVEIKKMMLVK